MEAKTKGTITVSDRCMETYGKYMMYCMPSDSNIKMCKNIQDNNVYSSHS